MTRAIGWSIAAAGRTGALDGFSDCQIKTGPYALAVRLCILTSSLITRGRHEASGCNIKVSIYYLQHASKFRTYVRLRYPPNLDNLSKEIVYLLTHSAPHPEGPVPWHSALHPGSQFPGTWLPTLGAQFRWAGTLSPW